MESPACIPPEGHVSWMPTRRTVVKVMAGTCLASALGDWALTFPAFAGTVLEFPSPSGALYDTVDGKKVLKCYAPSTVAGMSEMLGLNNPSFYPVEYNEYIDNLSQSPTLGIWGSSWNEQCNSFLSNLVYRDEVGGEVDDDYVAVVGSALQGFSQLSGGIDDSIGGIPLFMKHRPELMFISSSDAWGSDDTRTAADFVKVINEFDPEGPYYHEGDEFYDPVFIDARGYYGVKLGYMYSMWDLAAASDGILGNETSKTARYGSPLDVAGQYEQFMLASQYAVLRAISDGTTNRKTVAVIGGISDQTQGVVYGVDTSTGRARLDKFDPSTTDFSSSTQWGTTTNYNVRYYHAAAALENCCDNIIDVLGVSSSDDTDAPIIEDENGICWARPEALMQADSIIVRTQTTVSEIPGTDELYTILREYGYTDQSEWPDIYTSVPTIPGYGASNCGQLFWWSSYLGFVYPEILNPVHMGAYCCEKFFHIASSHLDSAVQLLFGEASLPTGYELSLANYSAEELDEIFAKGLEYYLFYRESLDARYVNLEMTSGMEAWLSEDKCNDLGISDTVFADVSESDWGYDAINYCAKAGLMTGYTDGSGNFGTYDTLSRAQIALVFCRIYGDEGADGAESWNTDQNMTGFTDVPDGEYYTAAVNWAYQTGVMTGFGPDYTTFGPEQPVTREQLCVVVGRVAELFGSVASGSVASAATDRFNAMPDYADVSDWAVSSVAWALNSGVIEGVDEDGVRYVRPVQSVERMMMAQFVMNAIENGVIG